MAEYASWASRHDSDYENTLSGAYSAVDAYNYRQDQRTTEQYGPGEVATDDSVDTGNAVFTDPIPVEVVATPAHHGHRYYYSTAAVTVDATVPTEIVTLLENRTRVVIKTGGDVLLGNRQDVEVGKAWLQSSSDTPLEYHGHLGIWALANDSSPTTVYVWQEYVINL